jgi:hypothetical protein
MSCRCLAQPGTSQESGQQQRCSKNIKRRRRRFQCNARRCICSTPLDHSHLRILDRDDPLPAADSHKLIERISMLSPTSGSSLPWPGWSLAKMRIAGVASMTRFRRRSLESHEAHGSASPVAITAFPSTRRGVYANPCRQPKVKAA